MSKKQEITNDVVSRDCTNYFRHIFCPTKHRYLSRISLCVYIGDNDFISGGKIDLPQFPSVRIKQKTQNYHLWEAMERIDHGFTQICSFLQLDCLSVRSWDHTDMFAVGVQF